MADTTLRELARRKGMYIGAAKRHLGQRADPEYEAALAREVNCTVGETQMKFGPLHAERGRFTFNAADELVQFAHDHGMAVRGHCLVWHHPSSLPPWFRRREWSREEALDVLRDHIQTVLHHFGGKCFAWDVVNEGLADEKGTFYREESPWLEAIGPDYIAQAFRWAHEADPETQLFYNDYEMDAVNGKSDRAYRLVRDLLDDGVPIHGIGLQGHIKLEEAPGPESVAENIARFNDLGLTVHLTEVDVWIKGEPSEEDLQRPAEVYRDLLQVAVEAKDCPAFVTWGLSDKYSWVPKFTGGEYGAALPLDENYHPKPAYHALCELLGR
ncbi:MAG: endo-1,4-beta-xylanase [Planctomycetota bacterium]